ncbi:nuclear envelope pore membrane protein POM 121C [Erinaceus europaeus]|uniref:Nuclear envelope pore membrane protein POM 121C n=1 Tax=Erinaceus europaeus TaxID=9365 RepID=A0ABM3VYS1_ERIEU|nr:nuclear envelope pore membrane protein POM 121C [Erinaceus europaeus]
MSPAAAAAGRGERRRPIASARDGRGRGGTAGAALLGLSLLGLALYLVPALAALAWLAVGTTAAWWGLSREPRGPRAFALERDGRRQRTLPAAPPTKPAANGNLLEPRSPHGGPDRAELLLMGSYLGKPGPPQLGPAPAGREPRERPGRRPAPRPAPPPPPPSPPRLHLGRTPAPSPLRPARRPPYRDCGTLSNRFVITPRRRYPIQQAQYSLLGSLPTVCWNGYHKKTVLSVRNSKMVCSPVTVRIAPPDSKLTRSPLSEQIISSALSSPSINTPDPCAKETVLNALKERKKRTVEEEDQIFSDGQENKRRRHDSSGSGQSAFEPLLANGVPASFVPKPGSLKRGLSTQSSEDHLNKRSRTSSMSSLTSTHTGGIPSSSRNAITSSYSSSRGFTQMWKRSGPSSSSFSSPASSRSQTPERPAKKSREEEFSHTSSSSTPLVADKESQGEKVAEIATWKKQNSWSSPPTPGGTGQRKRKVQLLPSRRGDQLALPPPPQLGYSITAEDLDQEKKASLQWFNKVLEDKTDAAPSPVADNPPATQPSFTFTLPATGPTTSPTSSTNPLLESLKKIQSSPSPPEESAGVATTEAQSPPKSPKTPPKTPSLQAPLGSSQLGALSSTPADSKPMVPFLGLSPAAPAVPASDTKSPPAPTVETPSNLPALTTASPAPPKQSLLFGMLSTPPVDPPANPPASAASGGATVSPMFKPIFESPTKSEKMGASPSTATPTTSSSATLLTTSTSAPTFKPIFDKPGPPTSVPLSLSFFTQTAAPATVTSAPIFTAPASAAAAGTSSPAPVSSTSAAADTTPKPMFSFGGTSSTSAVSSGTSTATSTSQPFLFGAPPASGASFTPVLGSMFQFGKAPATHASTAATTFGQSTLSSAPTASSSTGFVSFGAAPTTSAPAATSSQPTLTLSGAATPAFNIPFSSATKTPAPPYPGANSPPAFGAADGQQLGAKSALAPSFGSSFTFGNSAAPAAPANPTPTPAASVFGTATQSAFGGLKPPASTFGTPASTQPAFGGTTVFSFGTATTAGFGTPTTTQTTSSSTTGLLFGGTTTPSPFTFGGSGASRAFGISGAASGTVAASGTFSFGAGQSGPAAGSTTFGAALGQSTLGTASQSTPFAFGTAGTAETKPVFGGTSTPTFGQNSAAPGVGTAGSSLSFGASSAPAQGFTGVATFGSAAPSFSIGAGSKTPGARQRLQARRQHTRKK